MASSKLSKEKAAMNEEKSLNENNKNRKRGFRAFIIVVVVPSTISVMAAFALRYVKTYDTTLAILSLMMMSWVTYIFFSAVCRHAIKQARIDTDKKYTPSPMFLVGFLFAAVAFSISIFFASIYPGDFTWGGWVYPVLKLNQVGLILMTAATIFTVIKSAYIYRKRKKNNTSKSADADDLNKEPQN